MHGNPVHTGDAAWASDSPGVEIMDGREQEQAGDHAEEEHERRLGERKEATAGFFVAWGGAAFPG